MTEALVLSVEVDGPEVDLMEQMMRAGGYPSMEALVRTALWCHALAQDVDKAFPPDVAFMPVPRCDQCQHWEDGAPMEFVQGKKPAGRWGYCHLISTKDYEPVNPEALAFRDTESAGEHAQPLYVHESFGCVQFKPMVTREPAA